MSTYIAKTTYLMKTKISYNFKHRESVATKSSRPIGLSQFTGIRSRWEPANHCCWGKDPDEGPAWSAPAASRRRRAPVVPATAGGRLLRPHPAVASPQGLRWSIATTGRPPPPPSPSAPPPPSVPYMTNWSIVFCDLVYMCCCMQLRYPASLLYNSKIYSFVIDAPKKE